MQGVRALCDKYGILMICDEVMAGFGRTGEWFAIDHWNVVPDLITMAKGLTSAYVPLGAVGMRRTIADHFSDKVFYGGLTYNSHPLGVRGGARHDRGLRRGRAASSNARRMGAVMTAAACASLAARHPCVGAARIIGLFGIVELVRDKRDDGAARAVQRHVAGDGGARRSSSARKGSTRSCDGTRSSRTRRCASPRRSCAKASRSSTAGSPLSTGCSRRDVAANLSRRCSPP